MASKSLRRKVTLLAADSLLIIGALLFSIWLLARPGYFDELVFGQTLYFVLPVIIFLLAVYFVQGYHLEEIVIPRKGLAAMVVAAFSGGVATGFLFFVIPNAPEFSAKALILAAGLIALLLWLVRLTYGRFLSSGTLKENLLIVGQDQSARRLITELDKRKHSAYYVVGILQNPKEVRMQERLGNIPIFELADLPRLFKRYSIDAIVLGMREHTSDRLVRTIMALKRKGIKVIEFTDLFEEVTGMTPVQYVGELKMLFQNFGQRSEFRRLVEFIFNAGLAAIILLISLPLWPFIIIGQKLSSQGPVFYKSERVGWGGSPFKFYKFRTMIPGAEQKGAGLITGKDDPRVFPFGRVLRKTHLDEIPQLLNIVKGDMNFIGPRAEMLANVVLLEQKIPYYHERHMIKPGLTGWAQVRNIYTDASEQGTLEKIQYDLYYLKHRSLALDLAIVLRTVKLILKGRGTS